MPSAKPKVNRTCLVCDASFQGTPAATRCDSCRAAGLKVPRAAQMQRRKGSTIRKTAEEAETRLQRGLLRTEAVEAKRLEREAKKAEAAETKRLEHEAKKAKAAQAKRLEREAKKAEAAEAKRTSEAQKAEAAEAKRLEREAKKAAALAARIIEKTCAACHETFETHRPKASRCQPCIDEDRRPRKRTCLECNRPFTLFDPSHINCATCAGNLGIEQSEMSPAQLAAELEERQRERWRERHDELQRWLNQREARPKGYKTMTNATTKIPAGIFWLEVCAADGAAASVTYAASTDLSAEEKIGLLTSFMRLRVKGYHPAALAKLCPVSLLEADTQAAIGDLPKADEDPEPEPDPFVGMSMNALDEIETHLIDTHRRTNAIALGLAT